ncbi:MAG: hypothetical protein JF625_09915 [Inquilinus limosus]|uniref:DUF6950 domain-containing protein n=1 Tax=Inquilinus limosus TaxID=171674 RepID=A0A952FLN2_9PROT|nr:hypothetical protein [Inquilinus limosus]
MSRTDQDPMAAWRGRYRTALGLKRVLRRSGGMQEMLAAGMRSIGALQIDPAEAVAGDIGMILAISPSGDVEPSAAIRGQLGWLAKLGDGLWRAPSAMAAWRLP